MFLSEASLTQRSVLSAGKVEQFARHASKKMVFVLPGKVKENHCDTEETLGSPSVETFWCWSLTLHIKGPAFLAAMIHWR